MQVVILCGGKGTRAYPYTEYMPKPMMPIAGAPILLQVMRNFAAQGHTDFILSLGYRKDVIVDYFYNKTLDWNVKFIDTGEETDTGGRVKNLEEYLDDQFIVTYVDGLSDVDTDKLIAFHNEHDGMVTVTSVPLKSQYGTIEIEGPGRITAFKEKPVLREHWINAGFMVFDKKVFSEWGDGTNLEQHVLPSLVEKKMVYTYQHDGFFKSMDTYKDQQEIENMYENNMIPWQKTSKEPEHSELVISAF